MPAPVAGIHVLKSEPNQRHGWPGHAGYDRERDVEHYDRWYYSSKRDSGGARLRGGTDVSDRDANQAHQLQRSQLRGHAIGDVSPNGNQGSHRDYRKGQQHRSRSPERKASLRDPKRLVRPHFRRHWHRNAGEWSVRDGERIRDSGLRSRTDVKARGAWPFTWPFTWHSHLAFHLAFHLAVRPALEAARAARRRVMALPGAGGASVAIGISFAAGPADGAAGSCPVASASANSGSADLGSRGLAATGLPSRGVCASIVAPNSGLNSGFTSGACARSPAQCP